MRPTEAPKSQKRVETATAFSFCSTTFRKFETFFLWRNQNLDAASCCLWWGMRVILCWTTGRCTPAHLTFLLMIWSFETGARAVQYLCSNASLFEWRKAWPSENTFLNSLILRQIYAIDFFEVFCEKKVFFLRFCFFCFMRNHPLVNKLVWTTSRELTQNIWNAMYHFKWNKKEVITTEKTGFFEHLCMTRKHFHAKSGPDLVARPFERAGKTDSIRNEIRCPAPVRASKGLCKLRDFWWDRHNWAKMKIHSLIWLSGPLRKFLILEVQCSIPFPSLFLSRKLCRSLLVSAETTH